MNKRQTKKRNKRIAAQLALAASILGAAGGAVKSDRKTAASRANGKKGGRPRKEVNYKRLDALTGPGVLEYVEADDEFVLVDPKRPRKESGNE